MTAINTRPESNCNALGASPHTPGAHQLAGADWVEIPQALVRRHMLAGAFFLSKDASAMLAREPRPHVKVGERLLMGYGLEAFFGYDESQTGARAFFVEISLHTYPIHH